MAPSPSATAAARRRGYVELLRPANVATALADVLAGFAVTGLSSPRALPLLLVSTASLYAGGIVLNDVFDRHLDAGERPERPIPSGRVSAGRAGALGAALLALGVVAAGVVGTAALSIAVLIVGAVLLYDTWGKRQAVVGPVNMGLCRALNLALGMGASPAALTSHWWLGVFPLVYITAVTVVSRGEVSGARRGAARLGLALVTMVVVGLLALAVWPLAMPPISTPRQTAMTSLAAALGFTGLLAWRVLGALNAAVRHAQPGTMRAAVRTGVLSLVLLDAVIAAVYAGMIYSLAVFAASLLAGRLARRFAVT